MDTVTKKRVGSIILLTVALLSVCGKAALIAQMYTEHRPQNVYTVSAASGLALLIGMGHVLRADKTEPCFWESDSTIGYAWITSAALGCICLIMLATNPPVKKETKPEPPPQKPGETLYESYDVSVLNTPEGEVVKQTETAVLSGW